MQEPRQRCPRLTAFLAPAALAALLAPPAQAAAVTQWSGSLAITCANVAELYGQPCVNGSVRETDSGFSATGRAINGHQEIDSSYTLDIFGHQDTRHLATQWAAAASTGALRASSFSSFVMPDTSVKNPFEDVRSSADALFKDRWLIHGPDTGTRRISAHFSFNGAMGDLGGIALPGQQVNVPFGNARADFSVDFNLGGGKGQPVVVRSPGGVTGTPPIVGFALHRTLDDGSPNTQGLDFIFDVADGNVLDLLAHLFVSSSLSAYADFAHTATLDYILAPDDLAITTDSGTLLRQGDRFVYAANAAPDPGTSVPEPASATLVLLGLAGLGALRRRSAAQAGA